MNKIFREIKQAAANDGALKNKKCLVSDDILVKGNIASAGSKMLFNHKATMNAKTVELIIENGAQIIGSSNMSEFALFGATSSIEPLHDINQPHDVASDIAEDLADFALASDATGQLRISAAKSNICAFRPTYGKVSRLGLISGVPSMETISIASKDIDLIADVFKSINKYDVNDATSLTPEQRVAKDIDAKKVGLLREGLECKHSEPVLRACAQQIHALGYEVTGKSIQNMDIVDQITLIISSAEFSSSTARYDGVRYGFRAEDYGDLNDLYVKSRAAFGDSAKRMIIFGTLMQSERFYQDYFVKATKMRQALAQEVDKFFEEFDLMLLPAGQGLYAKIASLAGLPEVVIPVNGGSISLSAAKGNDEMLLKAAKRIMEENKNA